MIGALLKKFLMVWIADNYWGLCGDERDIRVHMRTICARDTLRVRGWYGNSGDHQCKSGDILGH